jgi:hypothetical protein
MAEWLRLSASRTGRALLAQNIFFSASGIQVCLRMSKPQSLVPPEGLGKLKNSMTSSEIEPATFRLVA